MNRLLSFKTIMKNTPFEVLYGQSIAASIFIGGVTMGIVSDDESIGRHIASGCAAGAMFGVVWPVGIPIVTCVYTGRIMKDYFNNHEK